MGRVDRPLPFWWGPPATGLARPGGLATPPVVSYGLPFLNFDAWFHLRLSGHYNLTVQASRLSSNILQRSFFFFARMSCSEQSAFHGQAFDRAWFFSELLFQSVAAKKKEKRGGKKLPI